MSSIPAKFLFRRSAAVLAALSLGASLGAAQNRPGAPEGPLTLVDAAGRSVRLEKPPVRIVVAGHGTHIVLHLLYLFPEGKARLAGTERWSDPPSEFLPVIDPCFAKVPIMEPNSGAEEIAALRPDVVLTRGSALNWIGESMDKINIPVIYLGLETPEQYFRDLDNLGLLLGNPKRAKEVAGFFRTRLDRIGAAVSRLKESEKPRVLIVMWTERGGKAAVRVPAASWIQTNQVRMAGGAPVWLEASLEPAGWTVVNLEQIAAWNPGMIFVIIGHTLNPEKILYGLKADSRWRELKAVRSGRLHVFPADFYGWDSPDPRWILGLSWLAGRIHPEAFGDIDIDKEILAFYGDLYGMDAKAVVESVRPAIRMDLR